MPIACDIGKRGSHGIALDIVLPLNLPASYNAWTTAAEVQEAGSVLSDLGVMQLVARRQFRQQHHSQEGGSCDKARASAQQPRLRCWPWVGLGCSYVTAAGRSNLMLCAAGPKGRLRVGMAWMPLARHLIF